jgi:hypothetical protein
MLPGMKHLILMVSPSIIGDFDRAAWLRIAHGWMSLLRKRPQSDEEAFNARTKARGTGQDDSESSN